MPDSEEIVQTTIHDDHFSVIRKENISGITKFVMRLGFKSRKGAEVVMVLITILFFAGAFSIATISFGWFKAKKQNINEGSIPPGLQTLQQLRSQ